MQHAHLDSIAGQGEEPLPLVHSPHEGAGWLAFCRFSFDAYQHNVFLFPFFLELFVLLCKEFDPA